MPDITILIDFFLYLGIVGIVLTTLAVFNEIIERWYP